MTLADVQLQKVTLVNIVSMKMISKLIVSVLMKHIALKIWNQACIVSLVVLNPSGTMKLLSPLM